jgi:hypothetical protein
MVEQDLRDHPFCEGLVNAFMGKNSPGVYEA